MTTSTREEAVRKTIHVGLSLVVVGIVWRLPRLHAATVLAAATLLALAVERARRADGPVGRLFDQQLGRLLRDHERNRLTGATTLAMGFAVTTLAFPRGPAIAGILVAGVADAVAAVVGKRFGRLRYRGGKSVEGSVGFLILVTAIVAILVPAFHPLVVLALAFLLTGLEALTLAVPDNLYLPVATAAAIYGAGLLTGVAFFS